MTTTGQTVLTPKQWAEQPDAAGYCWIITEAFGDPEDVMGPSNAHDIHVEAVQRPGAHRVAFRIYDDDGDLYYRGFMTWDPEYCLSGDAAYGPLCDYGMPDGGATEIRYTGHPELDCS